MDLDREHLRLLSIFHYVIGGIIAFFSCFPIIYLIMGIAMLAIPISETSSSNGSGPPAFMAWFFILISLSFILAGWSVAACLIYAGICLNKLEKYTFCLIIAAIACTFMPLGTILGVCTIIVLIRPAVKNLFLVNRDSAVYQE